MDYVPGTTTSAHDTVIPCAGVCRDFAHLCIAIYRALTIPARYFGAVTTSSRDVRCKMTERSSFRLLTQHDLHETAISLDAGEK